ncbi:hypothetical protein ABTZ58_38905 [Streptomyces sp. NPDC094143]|uniref:hypothetical protein n=1 Tax=Streptomyces sp. NPDC094143 TaxID=3155310 RepID=UPI0033274E8F
MFAWLYRALGVGGLVLGAVLLGRREKTGLTDQGLGLPAVVARLAQPNRLLLPAVLARQGLARRFGGRRLLALALRLLPGGRTGRLAAGLLHAGLLLPPCEAFRLDGHLLAQPLLEDPAALTGAQAGQLPLDLRRDLGPPGPPDVHHVAAHLALAARVQPDPVITPAVRARLTLHQPTPYQPRERMHDQVLAAGLLQPVGEPVGQQPRRHLRPLQHARQPGQLRRHSHLHLALLVLAAAAAVPVPEDEGDGVVGVVRLLDDDQLGKPSDPAAVLQSWLDSPAAGEILSVSEAYSAVVKSRYCPLEHLRQSPADEILARHEPEVALKILLDHCGHSTDRWEALAAAMTFDYDGEKITFGELLDSLAGATAET